VGATKSATATPAIRAFSMAHDVHRQAPRRWDRETFDYPHRPRGAPDTRLAGPGDPGACTSRPSKRVLGAPMSRKGFYAPRKWESFENINEANKDRFQASDHHCLWADRI